MPPWGEVGWEWEGALKIQRSEERRGGESLEVLFDFLGLKGSILVK